MEASSPESPTRDSASHSSKSITPPENTRNKEMESSIQKTVFFQRSPIRDSTSQTRGLTLYSLNSLGPSEYTKSKEARNSIHNNLLGKLTLKRGNIDRDQHFLNF